MKGPTKCRAYTSLRKRVAVLEAGILKHKAIAEESTRHAFVGKGTPFSYADMELYKLIAPVPQKSGRKR